MTDRFKEQARKEATPMVKRIWGIRHVRWLIVAYLMWRHYRAWGELMGRMPIINQSDADALDAIWRGEA